MRLKKKALRRRGLRCLSCTLLLSAVLMAGGCAMGEASGKNTTQGIAALEEENYQLAGELFSEAIREGEQKVLAYRGLGLAYMGLGRYEEAVQSFEEALGAADEKMPENVQDISLYLATAQYRLGEYEETMDICTQILERSEKKEAQAYYLRGAANLNEGLSEEAKQDFDAAVALAPEDYDLYMNIYECYRTQNLSGVGGMYLQSALDIQGDSTEYAYNRGRIYYYLGNYEEAQKQLIGPVEKKHEQSMYLIARVYLELEDVDHAWSVYESIQQEFGENTKVYNGFALCEMAKEKYDSAISYIQKGLALESMAGKQELYFNEIVAYERMLDFATARSKAEAYVEQYPGDEAGVRELTFLATRQ